MDYLEKRERGRINVTQTLALRSENMPDHCYHALSVDVSEDNIGFETEAVLSLGERIKLELATLTRTVVVNAIVLRNSNKLYGCRFVDDTNASLFGLLAH